MTITCCYCRMLHYRNAQRPLMRSDLQQSRYGTELKTSFEDTEQKDLEVDDSPAFIPLGCQDEGYLRGFEDLARLL